METQRKGLSRDQPCPWSGSEPPAQGPGRPRRLGLSSERFLPPAPAQPRRKWPPPEQRGRRTMAIELGRGARARTGHQLPALIRPLRGLHGLLDPRWGLAAGAAPARRRAANGEPTGAPPPAGSSPTWPRPANGRPTGVNPGRPRPRRLLPRPAPPRGREANDEPTRGRHAPSKLLLHLSPPQHARRLDLSRAAEAALGEVFPRKAEEVSASCVSCAYWKSRGGRP